MNEHVLPDVVVINKTINSQVAAAAGDIDIALADEHIHHHQRSALWRIPAAACPVVAGGVSIVAAAAAAAATGLAASGA